MMTKKKVLVTGGLGFVGRNLINRLKKENKHHVYVIDRQDAGDLLGGEITFFKDEIKNIDKYVTELKGLDTVIHLAANTVFSGSDSMEDAYRTFDDIGQSAKLLQICKELGVKRFVFSSSAAIYGNVGYTYEYTGDKYPVSYYGVSKLAIENLMYLYPEINERIVLRYFNIYGPNNDKGIINYLINCFKKNLPIQLYCNPKKDEGAIPCRDFIHIDDVVQVTKYAALDVFEYDSPFKIFNVGTGTSIPITDLVKRLSNIFDEVPKIDYLGNRKRDIVKSEAQIDEMTNILNYRPAINIDGGLKGMLLLTTK